MILLKGYALLSNQAYHNLSYINVRKYLLKSVASISVEIKIILPQASLYKNQYRRFANTPNQEK